MSQRPLRTSLRALAAAGAALWLGGCVSLLPKSDPAQLYSFAPPAAPAPPPAAAGASPRGLVLNALTFPRASTGDGMLTRTGAEAAYVAGARWVAPAVVLFREAAERSFDTATRVRLLNRGDLGGAVAMLRIDVRDFEVRYPAPEAAPTVVVSLEARLTRPNGVVLDERRFEATQPAAENRVAPIVDAFQRATGSVLTQTVAWADGAAGALPEARPGTATAVSPPAAPAPTLRGGASTETPAR